MREAPINNYSFAEHEQRNYASELRKRLSHVQAEESSYICKPLLGCEALSEGPGIALLSWMYFHPYGPTTCALFFTQVPGMDEGIISYNMLNPFAREWAAFGVVPNLATNSLPAILADLFAANGHESCRLLGGLPTSILHRDNWHIGSYQAPSISGDQARTMFRLAMQSLGDIDLRSRCEYLRLHKGDPWARDYRNPLEYLRLHKGFSPRLYDEWFDLVTDPTHVMSEMTNFATAWQTALEARGKRP